MVVRSTVNSATNAKPIGIITRPMANAFIQPWGSVRFAAKYSKPNSTPTTPPPAIPMGATGRPLLVRPHVLGSMMTS